MIAIIKNVKKEGPGSIEDYLKKNKITHIIFEAEDGDLPPTLDGYNSLVILGGPMGVYEMDRYPHLKLLLKLIEDALNKDLKVLGICLGSQLIAHVLGARVYKGHCLEIGWHNIELTTEALRDPLMLSLAKHPSVGDIWKRFKVFHWHGDTFDLPQGAVHLAKSALYENQAFRYKDNVYALQFHIEVKEDLLLEWFDDSHPMKETILKEANKIKLEYHKRSNNFYDAFWKNHYRTSRG
ncbi:MAG: type 1 glutamine amidotransferase [Thermodesulfovibrionales bacterium]|nr:type 1 glutamine amidotransferase [Thermodesulfovibrionales bacterium]